MVYKKLCESRERCYWWDDAVFQIWSRIWQKREPVLRLNKAYRISCPAEAVCSLDSSRATAPTGSRTDKEHLAEIHIQLL